MARFEDGCYGSLKGIDLIAKVLAGRCPMHYTRVAAGKGTIPDSLTPKTLTEPPEYVMDAMISSVTNPVNGECQVSVQINSKYVEEGFYAKWLILYAEDPDEGEVPFTVLCLENEPEWIRPSSSIVGKLAHFDLIAAVGDVDNVTATIDPEALVTLEAVKQLISEHDQNQTAHGKGVPNGVASLDGSGKVPEGQLPWKHRVVAARPRDPGKPDYGVGGGGEDGGEVSVALKAGPYTGTSEVGVVVSGVLYDAHNMSTHGDTAPDGTILIKTEEKENG